MTLSTTTAAAAAYTAPPQVLHFLVPGSLEQCTGGYHYDRRMLAELRQCGWTVQVHELPGQFPGPDPATGQILQQCLDALPANSLVVADGLAIGAFPQVVSQQAGRLDLRILVHHPLHLETGLSPGDVEPLRQLEYHALLACRKVITSSAFTARQLEAWIGPTCCVQAAPPGMDRTGVPDPLSRPAVPAKAEAGGACNGKVAAAPSPRLLCVGALVPRKGQDLLLHALAALRTLPWTLHLVGSLERAPDYVEYCMRTLDALDLGARVCLHGTLSTEALAEQYRHADLFVLPSWYEGYGMAFAEAMAYGLPVVASLGGASAETLPPGTGWFLPAGDVHELEKALQEALTQPAMRAARAHTAWRHAQTLPDWAQAAARLAECLQPIVQKTSLSAMRSA